MNTKEIKTEFIVPINKKHESLYLKNKAKAYSDRRLRNRKLKAKRAAKIKKIKNAILITLISIIGMAFVCSFPVIISAETETSTYTMRGKLQGNCVILSNGEVHEVNKKHVNYTPYTRSVTVILDNNGTEDVKDDIILNIF